MGPVKFDLFYNVINGNLVNTTDRRHGINPANTKALPPVPISSIKEVDAAIVAAKRIISEWADVPLHDRQERVTKLADALESQTVDFANMLTLETGKPLAVAKQEINEAVRMLKGIAALPFPGDIIEETEARRLITRYLPIGVCVGIVPWNFPLSLATFKLGPALVAGNPMILKASPFTPYCCLKLAELAQQFFPRGVVQALSGEDNLGPLLTAAPGVDKVSFTGSTGTGIKVMQSCARTLKSVTLELGGNDPAIVCADVDVKSVAAKITDLALYNGGQVCIAIKRVYVHSSIYDDFLAAATEHLKLMTVGDGMNDTTTLGPIQNEMQYNRLRDLIASIASEGLNIATGSISTTFCSEGKGYFMNPVIVDNPPDDSKIVTEEPFGPVFPIMKWDSEEEVVRRANDTDAGLGASIWSRDTSQSRRISRKIRAGTIWVNSHLHLWPNAPFGGHKQSGFGVELGVEGLKSYCNVQTVYEEK